MEAKEAYTRENLLMLNWSTLKFVGFNILTFNTLVFIWLWNIIEKLGERAEQATNRGLAIAAFSLIMWSDFIDIVISDDVLEIFPFFEFLSFCCYTAYMIIIIILSFKLKPLLEEFLEKIGKPYHLSSVWCFIFPLFYQYYVIYNIDRKLKESKLDHNSDQISKLTQLQALKESGVITEEEFQVQKEKILSLK